MGRPERPLDPEAGPLQRFAFELRQLRKAAGLNYRHLARRAHYSSTTLSEAAGGERLPTLEVTLAYAEACGGDRQEWKARWQAVATHLAPPPEETVEAGTQASDAAAAPYLGLVAFQPEDTERFFGREQLVAELVSRLCQGRFLAVFGASGSGKSSLLRAGLLPAVGDGRLPHSEQWATVLFTPGEHPLEELAIHLGAVQGIAPGSLHTDLAADPASFHLAVRQALLSKGEGAQLLLVVDQFEEVFTLCQERDERTGFIDALLGAVQRADSRTKVVLGTRADFYARCAEHPGLVGALRDAQVLIGPMNQDELRSVIVEPAAGAGLAVEPELTATILADMEGEPGALPLLSHALLETWRRRQGQRLTLAGYQAAGGVRGAIAQTAEKVYGPLDASQQQTARSIFLRLTALGEGTEDTRRRVARSEFGAAADPIQATVVLEHLAQARLITLGGDSSFSLLGAGTPRAVPPRESNSVELPSRVDEGRHVYQPV
jgi:transcriptional regulator with XRE-family HTH domain